MTPLDKFNRSFEIIPPCDCWIWTRGRTKFGYGQIYLRPYYNETMAHRAAWLLFRGQIPERRQVLHRCDNPPCVNPDHLYLGDALLNINDRSRRNRTNLTHLSREQVHSIRAEFDALSRVGKRRRNGIGQIAKKYRIARGTVVHIGLRNTWRWLP